MDGRRNITVKMRVANHIAERAFRVVPAAWVRHRNTLSDLPGYPGTFLMVRLANGRHPRRGLWLLGALCLFICGCTYRVQPTDLEAGTTALANLPRERALRAGDARDAWCVPQDVELVVETGPPRAGQALCVGILTQEESSAPVHVCVYSDKKLVAEQDAQGADSWHDCRIDIPDTEQEPGTCRVQVTSAAPFWVSHCGLSATETPRPNVLIYLMDALRPDHLGCYGYHRDTSPTIDQLAQEAVRFTDGIAQSSWTRPSVASLLTSTYPSFHGANNEWDVLRTNLPSLSAALKRKGYQTHCFMSNANCTPVWGFGGDFARFVDTGCFGIENVNDGLAVDAVLHTLDTMAGEPWFFYVHVMGPHGPYTPPPPYDTKFTPEREGRTAEEAKLLQDMALYDGSIAYSDAQFARLLERLRSRDVYDNTLIVFLSDHGEQFMEHGETEHGKSLFDEEIRVPLLMRMPKGACAGSVRLGLVELVDVAPTILDIVGAEPETGFSGQSLLGLIQEEQWDKTLGYASLHFDEKDMRAARSATLKYIHDMAETRECWYDLVADPEEQRPSLTPLPGGMLLAHHAETLGMLGAYGLHLLITAAPGGSPAVTGDIQGDGFDSVLRHCPGAREEIHVSRKSVRFSVDFLQDASPGNGLPSPGGVSRNYAHFCLPVPSETPFVVTVEQDGKPVRATDVFLGRDGTHLELADARILPEELAGGSQPFDPLLLPGAFGVYLWYVEDADTVTEAELSDEMVDALSALGYLD